MKRNWTEKKRKTGQKRKEKLDIIDKKNSTKMKIKTGQK